MLDNRVPTPRCAFDLHYGLFKTNKMKQTAVEWLIEQIISLQSKDLKLSEQYDKKLIEQAKEMEKQQIETAYNKAVPFKFGKEYYEETFKNK